MDKTVTDSSENVLSGWRHLALWPLGVIVRAWGATLRFELSATSRQSIEKTDEPLAFALWHNRLFIAAEAFRRHRGGRPLHALVSASRDGAWLTAFFSLAGMRAVRGSSSRLGRDAALALVDVLRAGGDIGITPDGPRGPIYEWKAGALIVARRARAPLALLGAEFADAWTLPSWDRLALPKPFSRVRIHCEIVPTRDLTDRDEAVVRLQARLCALSRDSGAVSRRAVV